MRTRNALERLAAAGRPVLAEAESLVDAHDEEAILARILASDRPAAVVNRRRRAALVIALGVIVATAIAAVSTGAFTSANRSGGNPRVALTGPELQLAGFRFRTPAGYKTSNGSCVVHRSGPMSVLNGFAAAASADGGCIEAFFMVANDDARTPAQEGATPVSVGAYQGYYVSENSSGESTLYVQLPKLGDMKQYLSLFAERLTEQQLVAIAQSGLPQNPDASRTMGPS
jgi:hypothetical protein